MNKKVYVLEMVDEDGRKLTLCVSETKTISDKKSMEKVLDEVSRFSKEIIKDSYLLDIEGEDSMREEFNDFVETICNGRDAEFYGDNYLWQEVPLIN